MGARAEVERHSQPAAAGKGDRRDEIEQCHVRLTDVGIDRPPARWAVVDRVGDVEARLGVVGPRDAEFHQGEIRVGPLRRNRGGGDGDVREGKVAMGHTSRPPLRQ